MDGNGDTEAENVIRLPRDWVGPPEELVPIGSRARAREARAGDDPTVDDGRGDVIPDAGDFWGESASAVHHVMRAPAETQTAGPLRRRRARPQLPRVRRRTLAMAAVMGAVVIVTIIGVSEGPGTRPAASPTAAAQGRPRKASTTSHGATAHQGARASVRGTPDRARAVPVRAFSERRSARPIAVRRHRARRGPSRPQIGASRPQTVITTAVTTPAPTTPVASTTISTPPSATSARDGAGTSTGTSTHRSAAPSSGPLGPGEASDCDPKCS